jgi:drug/metabolite transporter (DMT)-like permease
MLGRQPGLDLLALTTVQYAAGAVLLALVMLFSTPQRIDSASPALWGAAAWVSLGSSVAATLAFFVALRAISAATASAWQFLVPAGAVAIDAILGTRPSEPVVAGIVLAVIGVLIVSTSASSQPAYEEVTADPAAARPTPR